MRADDLHAVALQPTFEELDVDGLVINDENFWGRHRFAAQRKTTGWQAHAAGGWRCTVWLW
jgi:hypothetical protein